MPANPALQVFPGRGMTCVLDKVKSLCEMQPTQKDHEAAPALDDCQAACANIARAERHRDPSAGSGPAASNRR